MLRGNPQSHQYVHNLQNDERAHNSKTPCYSNAHELIQHLVTVAVNQAQRQCLSLGVPEDRVHRLGCKNARQQRPDGAACPVHAEHVQGIIITEKALNLGHHEEAEDPGHRSNDQGGHRSHET